MFNLNQINMKTKLMLLITSTVLSFSLSAKEIKGSDECVRNLIQTEVKNEFLNWDFSTLKESDAIADVSFRINEEGSVELKEIAGNDSDFNSLIVSNFSKIKLNADFPETDQSFYIRLSYKKR